MYLDQQEVFNKLPDEYAGKLIKHIFSYVNGEEVDEQDLVIEVAFSPIKQALKRDLKKWSKALEQRSQAGKASAKKRAERKMEKYNDNERSSTVVESRSTKKTVSENENVSVSVSVNDSVSDKDIKKPLSTKADLAREVFDYWVEVMGKTKGSKFNDKRKRAVSARLKEGYTAEELKEAVLGCSMTPYNMGDNPQHQVYDDLELICRDGSKVERFRGNSVVKQNPVAQFGSAAVQTINEIKDLDFGFGD